MAFTLTTRTPGAANRLVPATLLVRTTLGLIGLAVTGFGAPAVINRRTGRVSRP